MVPGFDAAALLESLNDLLLSPARIELKLTIEADSHHLRVLLFGSNPILDAEASPLLKFLRSY